MIKQNKTLVEASLELKASVNALHQARIDFMKAYEASVDAQIDDAINKDSFREKFGDRLDGGYGYSM